MVAFEQSRRKLRGTLGTVPKSRQSLMSPTIPPELFDLVIDHLHNEPDALKACCIVSKSFVTPARKQLFAHVEFDALRSQLERWKKTFPDPSRSPARHTRSLFIYGDHDITAADTGVGGWVRTFHNVTHLELMWMNRASFITFHGLSRSVRSLTLTESLTTEVFDLLCSFPLLEDLALNTLSPESDTYRWNPPQTSPKLTGTLDLRMDGRAHTITRRWLDFPNGLRFSKIYVLFLEEDIGPVVDLVSECSDTLECLTVQHFPMSAFPSAPVTASTSPFLSDVEVPSVVFLDLSKATKLKHLRFLRTRIKSTVRWITMTLQTVDSKTLQSITIDPHSAIPETVEEEVYQEWQDLDRLLVQFWTSHSIRPKVKYVPRWGEGRELRDDAQILLPELTKRGLVDLVGT